MSRKTCTCICVYSNAVANGVMLQLYWGHDFCNIVSKKSNKLYLAPGSPTAPPPNEKLWMCTWYQNIRCHIPENNSLYFCEAVNTWWASVTECKITYSAVCWRNAKIRKKLQYLCLIGRQAVWFSLKLRTFRRYVLPACLCPKILPNYLSSLP